ncbi:MAG: hypothetical protein ACOCSQ_01375 [Planctomycetota bacterium]
MFYDTDMQFVCSSFFANLRKQRRYMVGYEPALMPREDLEVFRVIREMGGVARGCEASVRRMSAGDTPAVRGQRGIDRRCRDWNGAIWGGGCGSAGLRPGNRVVALYSGQRVKYHGI